ncbi:N-acetyltransferase [Pediococcus pentosaceus]
MTFKIRTIEEKDIMETYEVIRNAFWDVYTPGCDEHYMVQQIRKVPGYIPELELVALDKDKIVGHVIFVKTVILTDQGKELEVISLGPIGVLPDYQRLGIGGQLIKTAIKRA